MLNTFKEHISTNGLFSPQEKLLVGVSGGVDSMVLCDLLSKCGYDYEVAHINHMTRNGESDLDEVFVKNHFEALGIKVHIKRLDMEFVGNFHDFAHKERYRFWESLGSDLVLTAHHLDDQIETILVNVFNGRSVQGMPVTNGKFVRPLLHFRKVEIFSYAAENRIPFRVDKSNISREYLRNVIRHEVLPSLKEFDSLEEKLLGMTERNSADMSLLKELVDDRISITHSGNQSLSIPLAELENKCEAFVYHALKSFGVNRSQASAIASDLETVGRKFSTSTHRLILDRESLIISENSVVKSPLAQLNLSDLPSVVHFNDYVLEFTIVNHLPEHFSPECLLVTLSKLEQELTIRSWQHGDTFCPFGMAGKKQSIKKFFVEKKVDGFTKARLPLLLSGNDIIWVVGMRSDDRYKVDSKRGPFLRVSIK